MGMLHFNNISLPFLSLGLLFVCFVVQFKYVIHYFNTNFTLKRKGWKLLGSRLHQLLRGLQKGKGWTALKSFHLWLNTTLLRVLLTIVAQQSLELEPMDIKITFLLGELEKNMRRKSICNNQRALQKRGRRTKHACLSPRHWYNKYDIFKLKSSFKKCGCDSFFCIIRISYLIMTLIFRCFCVF